MSSDGTARRLCETERDDEFAGVAVVFSGRAQRLAADRGVSNLNFETCDVARYRIKPRERRAPPRGFAFRVAAPLVRRRRRRRPRYAPYRGKTLRFRSYTRTRVNALTTTLIGRFTRAFYTRGEIVFETDLRITNRTNATVCMKTKTTFQSFPAWDRKCVRSNIDFSQTITVRRVSALEFN